MPNNQNTPMFTMNDRLYMVTKWSVQLVLPATATLYYTLSDTWNLPYEYQIPATITAVCAFLGIILGISAHGYYTNDNRFDGVMRVNKSEKGQIYDLELNDDPLTLATKNEISFKVDRST